VVTTMADPDGRPTVADFARRYLDEHAGDPARPDAAAPSRGARGRAGRG